MGGQYRPPWPGSGWWMPAVDGLAGRGTLEGGVAEGEHAAVGASQPVPLTGGGAVDPDDGGVDVLRRGRPEVGSVAEGVDPAVAADQPVALAVRGGGHVDDGGVDVLGRGRPEVGSVAEGVNAAVPADQPVALAAGR